MRAPSWAIGCALLAACSSGEERADRLGCQLQQNPRSAQICRELAQEMEFELMGHAIPAPGYKVTDQTLVRVYCKLGLSKDDEAPLRQLSVLSDAAGNLLKLVGADPVGPGNALSPESPSYILKSGCPAR